MEVADGIDVISNVGGSRSMHGGRHSRRLCVASLVATISALLVSDALSALGDDAAAATVPRALDWRPLPPVPDPIGVAGPFVGVHNGVLILAGGANFAVANSPHLWDVPKQFHPSAFVLTRSSDGSYSWRTGFSLDRPRAYGACVSTPAGVVCIGGDDGTQAFSDAFLLTWNRATGRLTQSPLPTLPTPSTAGGAAFVGNHVYLVAGQHETDLESAGDHFWRLDISRHRDAQLAWEPMPPIPGGPRAYPLVTSRQSDIGNSVYVIGGRRQKAGVRGTGGIEVLADLHEFSPSRFAADPPSAWRTCAAPPTPLMAGTAIGLGDRDLFVVAADDGSQLESAAADPEFVKRHPGFPRRAWAYDTRADAWSPAGETPACLVTTPAVWFDSGIVVVSGEVRPRVRSCEAWWISPRIGVAAPR